jgi:hypothetical protein
MTTIAAAIWLLSIPLVVVIGIALWATESRPVTINRWRKQGRTWQQIATRLGCSPSTARRWALA